MKSSIRRKWQNFLNLELPLLQKSGLISDNLLYWQDLLYLVRFDNSYNSSNIENRAQNMVGREGFEPSNPAMSRRYLNQARPPARFICCMCQALKFRAVDRSNNFILAIINVII